ncbi:MAG: hypothetical protein FWG53_02400 [Clostridiales bacterium]|nr:hypothetical protein [Clostridiales bacterium]
MEYYVYNDKNQKVYVSDEMLEAAYHRNGADYELKIINAMMESRNPKYINRLIEALMHEVPQNRINATFAILSLREQSAIPYLKNAISALDENDYKKSISIKAITETVIIMLEGGISEIRNSFFQDAKLMPLIKELFLSCYSCSHIEFTMEDIEFLADATSAYSLRTLDWIRKLKKSDYENDITCCFESFVRANEEDSFLYSLDDARSQSLASAISTVLSSNLGIYCKEEAIDAASGLRKQFALAALKGLSEKPFSKQLKKEYLKAMNIIDKRH